MELVRVPVVTDFSVSKPMLAPFRRNHYFNISGNLIVKNTAYPARHVVAERTNHYRRPLCPQFG